MHKSLLKCSCLRFLMGVCLCSEDGSSDVSAPLSVMRWGPRLHILPVKVATTKRLIALIRCLFWHRKLLIKKSLQRERGSIHIIWGATGGEKAEGNLRLSLMICAWVQPCFEAKLGHSRVQFHSWSKALCLSKPNPFRGWERTSMVLGLKCSVHSKISIWKSPGKGCKCKWKHYVIDFFFF